MVRFNKIYLHTWRTWQLMINAFILNFQTSFELSKLAVGSTIDLVDNILLNKVQNGMAIIRPPGHHAMKSEYNGYCFFNNVAIATQYAINEHNVRNKVQWNEHIDYM